MKKVDQRLQRLIESDICSAEDLGEYREKLIQLARERADVKTAKQHSRFFRALSDEKRLRILNLLRIREMCVCELMIALDVTQPNLSHHLRILENEGIVNRTKKGKWVYYSLSDQKNIKKIVKMQLL